MKNRTFYIKAYSIILNKDDIDLKDIPSIERRKLSLSDKFAIHTMSNVFNNNIKEIIFASRYGEIERLKKIIEQYKNLNETSPKDFSASVHNYPVGVFTLIKKTNIPYYAISSGRNTLSSGLLKCLLSRSSETLLCYADEVSVSCSVTQKEGIDKIEFIQSKEKNPSNSEFFDFIKFINKGTNEFVTEFGTFKRVK